MARETLLRRVALTELALVIASALLLRLANRPLDGLFLGAALGGFSFLTFWALARTLVAAGRRGLAYALGATKWQTIWHQVLPVATPGILTGLILALSRAIGETAPLIIAGAVTFATFAPDSIWSPFTVLPIQIFNWVSRPQVDFHANAAAGILVLVLLLLTMNAAAIWLRDRYHKKGAL